MEKKDFLHRSEGTSVVKSTSTVVSVAKGSQLFQKIGCIGCHSPKTKTEGMYGSAFGRIFGMTKFFEDGTSGKVDETYLEGSILTLSKKVVRGYNAEMPSFTRIPLRA